MISDSISHIHTHTRIPTHRVSKRPAIVHCPLEIGLGPGLGLDRTGLDNTLKDMLVIAKRIGSH